jgi:hypothetical protein
MSAEIDADLRGLSPEITQVFVDPTTPDERRRTEGSRTEGSRTGPSRAGPDPAESGRRPPT